MSRFKVEFTLKQHTPLIHFQADQNGATLRATELKPKFDKFLKEYVFSRKVPEKFLIDKDRDALNYKVTIEPNYENKKEIQKRDALFFANMKPKNVDEDEWERFGKKYFKEYKKEFKITFFSFNVSLLKILEENFESFLANKNFGSRQSKGYGSFYIAGKEFDKSLIKADRVYEFSSNNWKEDIKLFYSFLRQGINLKGANRQTIFYTKPLIYLYFKEKGIDWEKSAIKQFLNRERVNTKKHRIVRDLFGLSTSQFWMSYRKNITKEHKEDNKDKKIERLKSPITFKVVEHRVYFWANDSYRKLLGTPFKINGRLTLNFPDHFDIDDFFDFMIDANLNHIVQDKFKRDPHFSKLQRIMNQLKASK